MLPMDERHPSTVSDWDDARRRARLRETRIGHDWHRLRRTRLALLRVAALMLAVLIVVGYYWTADVNPERERLARTRPSIIAVNTPADPKNWDTVVVDMVGLGNLDATSTAAALPALDRIGMVWAIRYDNQGIDTKVIADLIVRAAEQAALKNIVLVGHSMGGVIALEVAKHIRNESDRRLVGVMLDCTPVDLNAVRPESRSAGEDLVRWAGWLPGARESRLLRILAETYARRDRFLHVSPEGLPDIGFRELRDVEVEILRDKILSRDVASNGLIEAQFAAIVAGGAADDLRSLARPLDGKPRPAIIFIRPRDPDRDMVVDDEYSHRVLIDISGGVNGTLLVVFTRTGGHANPISRPVEYNDIIENQILPFIQRYQLQMRNASGNAAGPH
ncbi:MULTISPECIES: alpha/beta hydrolase family protein [unclassified Nocardia]|uniref:alpha/beta hydrolase family protein n=1 Tax=unclassified Nocardia TaxID=2637762 RepID=UPI001CE48868|nr:MULTISPECIES: alpha/beta hydrolase [unclassified Nocardia]